MEDQYTEKDRKNKILLTIIGCLSAIFVVMLIFFIIEKNENKKHITAIHQEKETLQQELSELSNNYDGLKTSNDTLNQKLSNEQEKVNTLLEKMTKLKNESYAEISAYRKEINTLKTALRSYVVQIDSLNRMNQKLVAENTEVKKQIDWVRERNTTLESESQNMKEVIARARALVAENFIVYPINKKGKEISWKRCFQLKADFVIAKNITATRGERTIYLHIIRPDEKVIAFSEDSFFTYRDASLTYAAKREFEFEGERLEMAIYWPNDGSLIKGKYVAELFCDNELIGTTEFFLK